MVSRDEWNAPPSGSVTGESPYQEKKVTKKKTKFHGYIFADREFNDRMLYVMGAGNQVLGAFPISIGSSQDPLPEGTLQITSEVKNPDFSYNPSLLRNAKTDQKVKLPPGPNSPVGVMWMGLTKEHWGIHGTAEPSQMARVETNGCVRLTNWDVVRLSAVIEKGMTVEVQL